MSAPVATVRLADPDVAEVLLGQSPSSSTYNEQGKGLPFFQGKADFGLVHPTPRVWCTEGLKFAKANDVLMSVRAPVGDVNMATEDAVIGRGVAAIRASDGLDAWFLYFALQFMKPVLDERSTGTTFASVNGATLRDLEIPYFPDAERRSIGQVLKLVLEQAGRESAAQSVTRDLKHAVMAHIFTRGLRGQDQTETELGLVPIAWEVVAFSEIRESLRYGTSERCSPTPATYPVLRIPNILSAQIDATDLKYCDLPDKDAARFGLEDGDLIFIRTNGVIERLGLCAVYRGAPDKALFASYLIRARLLDGIDPDYVAYFMGSPIGIAQIASRATPAADGKFNLNTGIIDSLLVPLPSLDEQQEIARVLEALDRKISLQQRKREVLDQLFKSLLHKLMTGEVSINDLDLSALPAPSRTAA
jgi:type I restriction enzyme S subunit